MMHPILDPTKERAESRACSGYPERGGGRQSQQVKEVLGDGILIINVNEDKYGTMALANRWHTIVALYDEPQVLPLPHIYGKNLTFKTGGVDGCDCEEILQLIQEGKIDTTPLITHSFPLAKIAETYELFEQKRDGVIKVAITQ